MRMGKGSVCARLFLEKIKGRARKKKRKKPRQIAGAGQCGEAADSAFCGFFWFSCGSGLSGQVLCVLIRLDVFDKALHVKAFILTGRPRILVLERGEDARS